MSDDVSKSFVEKIVKQDNAIIKKLDTANKDPEKIYMILKERLDLYTTAEKLPVSDVYRLFFSSIKSTILSNAAVTAARKDFDEQVSQIISRLDVVEDEVKAIKDKLKKEMR